MERGRIDAVGLMIVDQGSRIFILSMSKDKVDYGQVAGMLSVPIEPIVNGESDNQALVRLINKKVGNGKIEVPPTFHGEFEIELSTKITERLRLYIGICNLGFDARPKTKDEKFFGWVPPKVLMDFPVGQKRPEIEPIISSYFAC